MPHSYTNLLVHCVFGAKDRQSFSEEFDAILNRHGMALDPGDR